MGFNLKAIEQRPVELYTAARQRLLGPTIAARDILRRASCYTISRRAVRQLEQYPELRNTFAIATSGSPNLQRMQLLLGAAFTHKRDEYLSRGAIRTALLTRTATLMTTFLNTHFSLAITTRLTGDAVDKEGKSMFGPRTFILSDISDLLY
ncbi:MAG: hypothetical protein QME05_06325, partial [Candidatus Margulisbacteria bacterium]|nr:hypothetical protein [Candidatus Margulisiibacteriota bacterium]